MSEQHHLATCDYPTNHVKDATQQPQQCWAVHADVVEGSITEHGADLNVVMTYDPSEIQWVQQQRSSSSSVDVVASFDVIVAAISRPPRTTAYRSEPRSTTPPPTVQ